ncbi:LamG-like jellyroll fold domain-containing protein [Flagellimonas algicola]|nr:LamG-like jellyroll fold domain-containing protein [Allomuricauda algicola]
MSLIRTLWVTMVFVQFVGVVSAQEPIFQLDFDTHGFEETIIPKEEAIYMVDLLRSEYAEGISGRALDLSANAALRRPVKLKSEVIPYTDKQSFSIQIWIKTLPDAIMGSPIIGNKKANKPDSKGWQLYTSENGAWALNLHDGKSQYDYRPTAKRQQVNDGKWHQIAFAINQDKEEVWMYLDGNNVAIYNTPGIGDFQTELATVVGGSDEKWEYGSYAQWNAFNGFVDEVKIWDRVVRPEEIQKQYLRFYPSTNEDKNRIQPQHLKVLAWNIWHGGHRYGEAVGVQRVIETIKATDADIIGLIETYGSGEIIADALGYHFYLISSNLSIMSRYPITETITAFKPFNFGGAKLSLGGGKDLIFFDTWLHYLPDYGQGVIEGKKSPKQLVTEEGETRHAEVKAILKEIAPYLEESEETPIVMSGDFNVGSHLDWIEETKGIHHNKKIKWPVSLEMTNAGFKDSYRELHIDPLLDPGFTWTPRAATSSDKYGLRDRIDYIFYQGKNLNAIESKVVDYHPIMFPSDHAGVLTVFRID